MDAYYFTSTLICVFLKNAGLSGVCSLLSAYSVVFLFCCLFSHQIRMNGWGVLSIQYLVQVDESKDAIFIEFLYLPAEDDADDSM